MYEEKSLHGTAAWICHTAANMQYSNTGSLSDGHLALFVCKFVMFIKTTMNDSA